MEKIKPSFPMEMETCFLYKKWELTFLCKSLHWLSSVNIETGFPIEMETGFLIKHGDKEICMKVAI